MCLLDLSFDSEYDLMFSAWGEGVLSEEGLLDFQKPEAAFSKYAKTKRRPFPKDISFVVEDSMACGYDHGITSVDSALLEKMKTLKELVLPASVTGIDLTPGLKEILIRNSTLIRGPFDSFAERFANETGLRFRPSDLIIAECFHEPSRESTTLKLVFSRGGSTVIEQIVSMPGSNAGNTMGGTFIHKLNREFFRKQTASDVADMFGGGLREALIRDGSLAEFIEKASERGYYTGKN